MSEKLLGDVVADIANKVHIDSLMAQIERLTKQKCNCKGRQKQLNELHKRVKQLISGEG